METQKEKFQYEVNAACSSDFSVSLSGCPVDHTDSIKVADSRIEKGAYLTAKATYSLWSIIPGKEKCLHNLCIVIGSAAQAAFHRTVRKFKHYFRMVKSTVLTQKPCFLRL